MPNISKWHFEKYEYALGMQCDGIAFNSPYTCYRMNSNMKNMPKIC